MRRLCDAAAALLGLDPGVFTEACFADAFAGNLVLPGSEPLAAVYSGHQFGVWAGQLGDGRAAGRPVPDKAALRQIG